MGDEVIYGHPIPLRYAYISINNILDKKYNKVHVDYLIHQDRKRLVQNKGAHVAWCKHFIMLDDQLSSDDNDREEDKLPLRDHEPIYHSPMPQHPTSSFPSPHTRQKRFSFSSYSTSHLFLSLTLEKRGFSSPSSSCFPTKI